MFGQLGCDVHAVLQPGQLGAGDALGVAAQAGRDARLPGLALRVNSDDWRNWWKQRRGRHEMNKCSTGVYTGATEERGSVIEPEVLETMPSPELMVWH